MSEFDFRGVAPSKVAIKKKIDDKSRQLWVALGIGVAALLVLAVIVASYYLVTGPSETQAIAVLEKALGDWVDGKQMGSISNRHREIKSAVMVSPEPGRPFIDHYDIKSAKRIGVSDCFWHVRVDVYVGSSKYRYICGVYPEGGKWAVNATPTN